MGEAGDQDERYSEGAKKELLCFRRRPKVPCDSRPCILCQSVRGLALSLPSRFLLFLILKQT